MEIIHNRREHVGIILENLEDGGARRRRLSDRAEGKEGVHVHVVVAFVELMHEVRNAHRGLMFAWVARERGRQQASALDITKP